MSAVRAIVSLGSNVEPREENLQRALDLLCEMPETRLVSASPVEETDPVDVPVEFASMKFLNQVVVLETSLDVHDFSRRMHEIEDRLGRVRTVRNGPRTIDIDLIDFDGLRLDEPDLTLPHPRAGMRDFVMRPLAKLGIRKLPGAPSGFALLPFLVFALFYVGLSLWAGHLGFEMPWYKVSMPVAFLVASATSLLIGRRRLEEKIEIYARGMGDSNIMMMCLIFILAGAFATIAKGSGAVDAAVTIAQALVPARLMVAGVFLVSCLIALAIGTSCGTIAAVTPIALGFAVPLQLDPALLVGAVIGGSMFGDNLSMISDTTIAATRTQGVGMKDKFLANGLIASPAALVALFLYAVSGSAAGEVEIPLIVWQDVVLILPYVLVLALAIAGFNVMALLFSGTVLSAVIGGALGRFSFFDAMDLLGKGTVGMGETLIVALLAGGLFRSVQSNGGVRWITDRISCVIRGAHTCEFGVFLLVAAVNCFTANNTVAIVIAGPVAKECAARFGASPVRIASVLDTASCVVQGLIPYGAQILIAMGVAKGLGIGIDSFSLVKCLYYQPLLAISVFASMAISGRRRR
jgi:2-amino-4-hydroxy-6-hydroxymethyldihydropteridine diphosphokinase